MNCGGETRSVQLGDRDIASHLIESFVDSHDVSPGNGAADKIDASAVTREFVEEYEALFFSGGVSSSFVHELNAELVSHMDLDGAQAFYGSFFTNCPERVTSVLCEPFPMEIEDIPDRATSILNTPHADRVFTALGHISEVNPGLGTVLYDMAIGGKILYLDTSYPHPALVDPRNPDTIILSERVFTMDVDKMRSTGFLWIEMGDPKQARRRAELFRRYPYLLEAPRFVSENPDLLVKRRFISNGFDMHVSGSGSEYARWARSMRERGIPVQEDMMVEETLVHEARHIVQMTSRHPLHRYRSHGDDVVPGEELYSMLVYMDLSSRALSEYGISGEVHSLADIDASSVAEEGLRRIVREAYDFTEGDAKMVAGGFVQRLQVREASRFGL